MNWINNVIEDIQHKILKTARNVDDIDGSAARHNTDSHDTSDQIRKFQGRLCDLDKRLLDLR